MHCTGCHFWSSRPTTCPSCRTLCRIQNLFRTGAFLRSQEDAIIQILRSACGAIEDLSELAIPVLKKEKAESNPPGFESEGSPGTGATEAAPASASEPVLEAPPGNFTKEEHTEEKEPVETVQAIPLSEKEARGEETETKKKKRKRKHRSGPSTKKEKRKKKKVQAEEEEQAGARSTAAPVEDLTTTQEEKDLQVHENPKKFELKPAPKGSGTPHSRHHELPTPPPAPRRPRSPDHPPPRRGRDYDRGDRYHRRERSKSIERRPYKKRGTKGVKHRERGRYWPYRR